MTDISSARKSANFTVALLCGGPSLERGISLNSARSVMDHLESEHVQVQPFYFDQKREAYALSPTQLYSNTPADFDFKLNQSAEALSPTELEKRLKRADIVFPVMHGSFGEDGQIQKWLEERDIPFVGSSSEACKRAFDKHRANEFISANGFYTLPSCLLRIFNTEENKQAAEAFFKEHGITRAVVKPASGGSSIGVFSVGSVQEALEKAEVIFSKRMDTRVVIEPFATGKEFTVIVLQNRFNLPVAILPTEIETDYTEHQLFDFRKKYLPTRQVTYHCPPRFETEVIERIQLQAEQLFALLGMRDFARFDGWVFEDGSIWFSDFNPVSGMEQNSFLFQQSARIGLSHRAVLEHIVTRACERSHIRHPFTLQSSQTKPDTRQPLAIIMGGSSSERQVSLMSGTNVWLKLRDSRTYRPVPYLIDIDGSVWQVPYQLLLNHTVEEITYNCRGAAADEERVSRFEKIARERLGLKDSPDRSEFGTPEHLTLNELLDRYTHVFIALHGGMGENGQLQALLDARGIAYNGPDADTSRICIDKQATAEKVRDLQIPGVQPIQGVTYPLDELVIRLAADTEAMWHGLLKQTAARSLIAKPSADGCSSGVVRLHDSGDLKTYLTLLTGSAGYIPANTFRGQTERIELPLTPPDAIRFEKHMRADTIRVKGGTLRHVKQTGLVEITIGVIETPEGIHALNPSIAIADGEVLSVEEKFQGGTGINLTPPPESIMPAKVRRRVQRSIERLASELGVRGYSRIDAFVDCTTGEVYIIEVNTLPGLTASTVIFQQALAERPSIHPRDFLELLAGNKSGTA